MDLNAARRVDCTLVAGRKCGEEYSGFHIPIYIQTLLCGGGDFYIYTATSPCGDGEDAGLLYIYTYIYMCGGKEMFGGGVDSGWCCGGEADRGESVSSGKYLHPHVRHAFS